MSEKLRCVFIDDLDEQENPHIEYIGFEEKYVVYSNSAYVVYPQSIIILGDNTPTLYYRKDRRYPMDIDHLMKSYGLFLNKSGE